MRAINIYILTRMINEKLYSSYEKALSQRDKKIKIRVDEIELIRTIIYNLKNNKAKFNTVSDWFYSFTIPQIGKEFDLIKLGENKVAINLELKSQPVSEEKIVKQLNQNRYYLSTVANVIYSFCFVKENDKIFNLYIYDGNLRKCEFPELIDRLSEIETPVSNAIENLFRPKEFLISPLNTPEKYINGNYYLTAQQEEIKREIICKSESNNTIWGIKGAAGTGKTLLLYDIAKTLSKRDRVCVIHSGILSVGHEYINRHLDNVLVIGAKTVCDNVIRQYPIICVDEAQRLYRSDLDCILEAYASGQVKTCIFSYDYAQVLSKVELNRNIPKRLNAVDGFEERKLTDKIRTNKELSSFIRNMLNLNDKPKERMNYDNVDILYASTINEADSISNYYKRKGYKFITFTPSNYVYNLIDHYADNINSHHVIGQEFDSVVVVMDNNFRYGDNGDLCAKEHPNPDYLFPNLFYQNITRAREKMCIIVFDNPDLFSKLLGIKEYSDYEDEYM